MTATKMKEILHDLDIGSSVAEFDEALEKYFVENEAFRALVLSRADIVAGDKGTGKTALYRTLQQRQKSIPELAQVEIVSAFNPAGNPIFQRLVHQDTLSEAQYISVWKTYVFSLLGNWLIESLGPDSENMRQLEKLLDDSNLRARDDKPDTIFNKIVNSLRGWLKPASAEVELKFNETGIPIVTPKVVFGKEAPNGPLPVDPIAGVRHEEALRHLNKCLSDAGVTAWMALDRLDEAFQGSPQVEVPALRALLRTYLDLLEFESIRLKLFLRRDLFRRIIDGGFVNLTHLNARKHEIIWDEDDLLSLLCRRIRERVGVISALDATELDDTELFNQLFPSQIDVGDKKPTSWKWIMSRIRDGNHVISPRNLIDLTTKALEAQRRREDRNPRDFAPGIPLLEADSVKDALARLSEQRVEDTLLAEAGDASPLIEAFRGQKSEHNLESLAKILRLDADGVEDAIQQLCEIGFFEKLKASYKVPMLYRGGLNIVQGKAF